MQSGRLSTLLLQITSLFCLVNVTTSKNCIKQLFDQATYDPAEFHVSLHHHRSVQKGYRGDYDFIYLMRFSDDQGEKSVIFNMTGVKSLRFTPGYIVLAPYEEGNAIKHGLTKVGWTQHTKGPTFSSEESKYGSIRLRSYNGVLHVMNKNFGKKEELFVAWKYPYFENPGTVVNLYNTDSTGLVKFEVDGKFRLWQTELNDLRPIVTVSSLYGPYDYKISDVEC